MRLALTTLINFNGDQGFRQKSTEVPLNHKDAYQSLVDPWVLFAHLKDFSDNGETDVQGYHRGLMSATLSFKDLSFRHQYFDWIYSKYSKSATNRRRIQRNEREILLKWARQFNHYHHHLKIIQIEPIVNNNHLMARFQLIGFNLQFGQVSFNFRIALENEYQQEYDQAFIHLENDESNRLVSILEADFNQYFPEANFTFVNQKINSQRFKQLKPVKFDPKWISHQQQRSAAESRSQLSQLQKTYNSVASSASVRSTSDSQMISKLQNCLRSASDERNSLIAAKSQEIMKLSSSAVILNKSITNLKNSLSSRQSKLSMFQSQATSYSSIADQNSNQAADLSNQSNASAIAANSVQGSLRSNVASQFITNQQLDSKVRSLTSMNQSGGHFKSSLMTKLSNAQSKTTNYSLAITKMSSRAIEMNNQSKASLKAAKLVQSSLRSNIASQLAANHQLNSRIDSLSTRLLKANSLSSISAHNTGIVSSLKSQIDSMSVSASNAQNKFNIQSNLNSNSVISESVSRSNTVTHHQSSSAKSNDIILSVVSSSNENSSVKYASDYNFALANNKSLSAAKSLSFSQPVKVNKSFQSIYGSSKVNQSNASLRPHVKWAVKRETNYVPIIIIIISAIALLIGVFILLKS